MFKGKLVVLAVVVLSAATLIVFRACGSTSAERRIERILSASIPAQSTNAHVYFERLPDDRLPDFQYFQAAGTFESDLNFWIQLVEKLEMRTNKCGSLSELPISPDMKSWWAVPPGSSQKHIACRREGETVLSMLWLSNRVYFRTSGLLPLNHLEPKSMTPYAAGFILLGVGFIILDFFLARLLRKMYPDDLYWTELISEAGITEKERSRREARRDHFQRGISHRFRKWGIALIVFGLLLLLIAFRHIIL